MINILVLTDGVAHWTQWQRGQLTAEYSECLSTDTSAMTGCPWLSAKDNHVHLIVDSPLEEIDRVPLVRTGSRLSYWLDRRALVQRLTKQQANATINWNGVVQSGVALVHHRPWPDAWRDWLCELQRENFTLVSVQSVSQLFASVDLGTAPDQLLLLSNGRDTRHVLYQRAQVVFTRIVASEDSDDTMQSLQDTLQHLEAQSLLSAPINASTLGIPTEQVERIGELAQISAVTTIDKPLDNSVALDVASKESVLPGNRTPARDEYCTQVARYAALSSQRRIILAALRLSKQPAREPVLHKIDQRHTLQRLFAVTALTLFVAAFTVLFAFSEGMDSVRHRDAQTAALNTLRASISEQRDLAQSLHAQPAVAAASIQQAQSLRMAVAPSPVMLLRTVADAYTAYPAVHLDAFSWVSVDHDAEVLDSVVYESNNAPLRQQLPDEEFEQSRVQVALTGSVSNDLPLRERQQRFRDFVGYLQSLSLVEHLWVDSSPVDALSENITGQYELGVSSMPIDYRVRLLLRAPQS